MAPFNDSLTAFLACDDPLDGLSALDDARKTLDLIERQLIEAARAQNVGWAQIASALRLRSRQAAEQRWLRLCGELGRDPRPARLARRGQRSIDKQAGLEDLRAAVLAALRHINADPGWDKRHPRAALCRTTLSAAAVGPAGALYALAKQSADDLDAVPADAPALQRLRTAVAVATPAPPARSRRPSSPR